MNKNFFAFILLASLLPAAARADAVQMPAGGSAASAPASAPRKGLTMSQVVKQFGEPQTKHAAVGGGSAHQPPITRWDYNGFSVFFEHEHVVDSVVPGDRPEVKHEDQLKPAGT
jgi:hypothetical protein